MCIATADAVDEVKMDLKSRDRRNGACLSRLRHCIRSVFDRAFSTKGSAVPRTLLILEKESTYHRSGSIGFWNVTVLTEVCCRLKANYRLLEYKKFKTKNPKQKRLKNSHFVCCYIIVVSARLENLRLIQVRLTVYLFIAKNKLFFSAAKLEMNQCIYHLQILQFQAIFRGKANVARTFGLSLPH